MATGTDITKTFADRLSDLIDEKRQEGKTFKDIAAESGVPTGSLSKYQNDAGEPGINSLIKLAEYFGVSTDYMLGITDIADGNADDMAIAKRLGLSSNSIEELCRFKHESGESIFLNHLSDGSFWDILIGCEVALINYLHARSDEFLSFRGSPEASLLYEIDHVNYRPVRNKGELGFTLNLSAEHYYDFCIQQASTKLEGFMKDLADSLIARIAADSKSKAPQKEKKRQKPKENTDNG